MSYLFCDIIDIVDINWLTLAIQSIICTKNSFEGDLLIV